MRFLAGILSLAPIAFGANIYTVSSHVIGEYVEARNADVYTGPCFANGEVGFGGDLAVMGWKIQKGAWEGVPLDGLSVIGVIRASHTLGDVTKTAYPVKSVLIIDERAGAVQRLALKSFAQRMGNDLLTDVVRIEYAPISFTFDQNDVHSMKAHLVAGELAKIQTRAINAGDHLCGNEDVYYSPLTKLDHAMPAATVAHSFRGEGLNSKWSSPDKRSAFVGTFEYRD